MSVSSRGRPREIAAEIDLAAYRYDSAGPEGAPARHALPAHRNRQAAPPVVAPQLGAADEVRVTVFLDELTRATRQLFGVVIFPP